MLLKELTKVGSIRRPHGLNGMLKVSIDPFYQDEVSVQKALVIKLGDDYLPFFVEQFEPTPKDSHLLKFDELHSKEDASKFTGKDIFAITDRLRQLRSTESPSLTGFKVFSFGVEVGIIEEIIELPGQLMLKLEDERLIPFVEDWIIEVDEAGQSIILELPEGLLDL